MPNDSHSTRSGPRAGYRHFLSIPTRWMDNDAYGHVNNVTYYSYFDTAVNEHLIKAGGLDLVNDPIVGYVVENSCRFKKPLSFPDVVEVGLRVAKLGTSSVCYEIGIFVEGDEAPRAIGTFVHVWVDRVTQRPAPIPARIRSALESLVVSANETAQP